MKSSEARKGKHEDDKWCKVTLSIHYKSDLRDLASFCSGRRILFLGVEPDISPEERMLNAIFGDAHTDCSEEKKND